MTDHDPALVEKVATTLWSLECRAAEALHDEPLEVHNGFWRDARAVLDAVVNDIARAERERVLAEVEAVHRRVTLPEHHQPSPFPDRCATCWGEGQFAEWPCPTMVVVARLRDTPASVPSDRDAS